MNIYNNNYNISMKIRTTVDIYYINKDTGNI